MEEIKNTDCNLITGLTSEEVEARVKSGLVNGLQTIKTKSVLRILIDNTFTFFNFVFFVMAIIVAAFSGFDEDGMGNYGFVILCVCNTLIGIVQELRAKHTMDKLSLISAPKVRVIRDGEEKEIAVKTSLWTTLRYCRRDTRFARIRSLSKAVSRSTKALSPVSPTQS